MVYLFLADGFEEIEALCCTDILRRAGIEVNMVGVEKMQVCGAHGITVLCDTPISKADIQNADAVILPGGLGGTNKMKESADVKRLVKCAYENEKKVCAICAAPSILGEMGLLNGKKATCYPGFEKSFAGGTYTEAAVQTDGNVITSKAMGTAYDFAFEIVKALNGEETAQRVKSEIYYAG